MVVISKIRGNHVVRRTVESSVPMLIAGKTFSTPDEILNHPVEEIKTITKRGYREGSIVADCYWTSKASRLARNFRVQTT